MLMALGAADREQFAYDYGRLTAIESTAVGFNWTFAPVADLALNWLNPAVFTRCVGSDPERVIAMLVALIKGFQEHGLSATAKHFPGDGVDFRNQHLQTAVNSLSENDWLASFGKVYAACIGAGVRSIMVGHIALPWLDKAIGRGGRPRPATVSPKILTDLLRSQLGFDGIIVSDALIMAGFTGWADYTERIIQAFNAGVDVLLWPGKAYLGLMERAIEDGRITEARLDEAVARILAFKERQGLFGQDFTPECLEPQPNAEAATFSRHLAEESVTLVRNSGGLVPLPPQHGKSVLLLFSTPVPQNAGKTIAPMIRAFEERGAQVKLHVNGNCLDIHKMEESGERFDTFLCVYELGMHMKSTSRPAGEMAECLWTQQYSDTLRPITISLGTPYLLNELPHIDTLINAYGPAIGVQQAVVALLCGDKMFHGSSPVPTGGSWINPFMGGNVLFAGGSNQPT